MKKIYNLIVLATLISTITSPAWAQNVNIPDPVFKNALLLNPAINTNSDGEIQFTEANSYSGAITVNNLGITSLVGIEAFHMMTELECYGNQLSSLNVYYCASLTTLHCEGNQIDTLVLSLGPNLTTVFCNNNLIPYIDISIASNLQTLVCFNNYITNLFPTPSLVTLNCNNNLLTSLSFAGNMSLNTLHCNNNQLTSLFLGNPPLTTLNCNNNQLTSLDISDLNGNNIVVNCQQNQLSSLNVGTAGIRSLNCSMNQLTSLDISGTPATALYCNDNQLNVLNVKNGLNQSFTDFYALNNSNLQCIQVDDAVWSTANWTNISAGSTFSDDCAYGNGSWGFAEIPVTVFPNPGTGVFRIENADDFETYEVFSVVGNSILSGNFNYGIGQADISNAGKGIYFLVLRDASWRHQILKLEVR